MSTKRNKLAALCAVAAVAALCFAATAQAQQRERARQNQFDTYQSDANAGVGQFERGREFIIIFPDTPRTGQQTLRFQQQPMTEDLQVREQQTLTRVTFPQGIRPIETAGGTREAVRDVFASITEAALDTDDIEDVIDQLAENDRERLGAGFFKFDITSDPLIENISAFMDRWNSRYGGDFGILGDFVIRDESQVFDRLSIRMGEVTDSSAVASAAWPVDILPLIPSPQTQVRDRSLRQRQRQFEPAKERYGQQGQRDEYLDVPLFGEEDVHVPYTDLGVDVPLVGADDVQIPGTDVGVDVPLIGEGFELPFFGEQPESDLYMTNLQEGQEVAVVTMPSERDTPALRVSMVHEFPDFWRIDIPDSISFADLKRNLNRHVNYLNQNFDRLPNDEIAASRIAGKHILMAVYGIHPNPRQALNQYRQQSEQFVRQRSMQQQNQSPQIQRQRVR